MKYRPEIDGLRAVAVIPVVFFHAGLPGFSAGYVGVDLFFVISGFLITTILVDEITNDRFSIIGFYERRARRILPALFLVLVLCIPFAWMWMLPDDLENMGQSIVATLLFANNILLTLTTGYWDMAGEFKPLLHTWSLGVEEQFYVIFPVLLLLIWRHARPFMLPILISISIISLILFLLPHFFIFSSRESAAVFYSLPTRAWQLLMGALAAFLTSRDNQVVTKHNAFWSMLGLTLVLISLFLTLPRDIDVTLRTLIGTFGATLVVIYASDTNFSGRFLANRVFVLIGLTSYSIYLFHQPLIALTRVYVKEEPVVLLLGPVVLTFFCAVLSYRFVEKPFRDISVISNRVAFTSLAVVGFCLLIFGIAAHMSSGFPQRTAGPGAMPTNFTESSIAYNQRAYKFHADSFPEKELSNVLVLGNSFGRDMVGVLLEAKLGTQFNLIYRSDHYDCIAENTNPVLRSLLSEADIVFMASSVLPNASCLSDDIGLATKLGVRIVYVGTKHFGYNLNWIMRVPHNRRANLTNALMNETIRHEIVMSDLVPSENYMSILDVIRVGERVPITDASGQLLSPDRTHLSQAGARLIADALSEEVRTPNLRELFR